jgi:tetratricopeptide (TPR) repeat protein
VLLHNPTTVLAAGCDVTQASTYRFGPCELDEACRSLSAHGREIRLQPRVFDLLCYLVRHRDRVVPKEELLDALWPGSVVIDNALQRVVSVARSALAEAGLPDAVRTYSRLGYRFCLSDDCGDLSQGLKPSAAMLAEAARQGCERSDWVGACEHFAAADAESALPAGDVEQWGRAAICAGLGPSASAALERVVAECDAQGDTLAAARSTLLLVQIRIDNKQAAMARGLLQRASLYLSGQGPSVERGHFAWMAARMAIGSGNAEEALSLADEACTVGRHLRDPDVECLGLVYRGHALMSLGQLALGLAQHEEAAAVIRLGGVRSWVAGWALCAILYAARHRCDWLRAAHFSEAFSDWSRASRMPAFPGTCQLHRAAVLGVQGDLDRAEAEVRAAADLLAHAAPWAEGDAYCVLGDIQLSHGHFEAAEVSLRHAHSLGWDPQPALARLHLLMGRPAMAQKGLERALSESDWSLRERRGQLLCLLVQAAAQAGDLACARESLAILGTDPQMLATEALRALHAVAEAEMAIAEHDVPLAMRKLRVAVQQWREAGSQVGEAEARLRLAGCLAGEQDAEGTELELDAVEAHLAAVVQPHRQRIEKLRQAARATAALPVSR